MYLYNYVKLQETSIYSKLQAHLRPENVKVNQNYIWDTLKIDWKEVSMTFNSNKINLVNIVMIKFWD